MSLPIARKRLRAWFQRLRASQVKTWFQSLRIERDSSQYIEVYIDDKNAGSAMEKSFNIPASCWRHANANPDNANSKESDRSSNRSSDRSSSHRSSSHRSRTSVPVKSSYLSTALNFHADLIVQVWFTLPSYALLAGVIVYGLHTLSAGRRTT
jgi:hypothetical protein